MPGLATELVYPPVPGDAQPTAAAEVRDAPRDGLDAVARSFMTTMGFLPPFRIDPVLACVRVCVCTPC